MALERDRRPRILDVALYLVGVAGLAAALTVLFLGMRAVMDVGGYCAEGGPYVIETRCPEGVALLIPLSIFAGLASAALVGWKGSVLGSRWAAVVGLAWPALFISLGWNFLEYAFSPPGPEEGIVWGVADPGRPVPAHGLAAAAGGAAGATRAWPPAGDRTDRTAS